MVLKGLYTSKIQDFVELQIVFALYEQENIRSNEQPSYARVTTSLRRHLDQTMRTRNFRAQNESGEKSSNQESKKKRRKYVVDKTV